MSLFRCPVCGAPLTREDRAYLCPNRHSYDISKEGYMQEKNIGNIAEIAAKDPDKRIVMIAGPSSSGKTTFSHRLATHFQALGYNPHPIAVDNYFRNREDYPKDEFGNVDMEALGCVDIETFNEHMNALLAGEKVEIPRFNFHTGKREYKGNYLQMGKKDVLIIEGIHCHTFFY